MKVSIPSLLRLALLILLPLLASSPAFAQAPSQTTSLFTVDATAPPAVPETGYLQLASAAASKSADGHVLAVNGRYLMLDEKPWLPVMGEFHFSRYPAPYWEEEILKMKAGGVQIISTYVFWIHHEEVEGQFDWSGQRDLRTFVQLCGKHGMYVYPRIGPWAHGESRNGGLPDWLLHTGPTRVNDPDYLAHVRRYYGEVGKQLKGLLWEDGGPIIGIQIENEYTNHSPKGGAAHIATLKSMALEAGLDVPLYTVTGWGNALYPPREVIPVFGGYPDEAWSGSLQELPPGALTVYQFHVKPAAGKGEILQGTPVPAADLQLSHYPRFTAELGGGMQTTYHRRVVISDSDIPPMAVTALGSGVNLLGYYMFQGGANPSGKLTTLQESQSTNYPNDVPVRSYDFQAPLRQYGQMNGSFRKLKVLHQFLRDFGSNLAPMAPIAPDIKPSGPSDITTLRIAARTAGNSGFVFFNNYVRNYPLPEQKNVQVLLKFPSENLTLPRNPASIPSQSSFFWPVNLDLSGALLKYATAQPFAKLQDGKFVFYFFSASPGVVPEFAFASSTITSLELRSGVATRQDDRVYVTGTPPSTAAAIDIKTRAGNSVRIVLLSPEQAEHSWKVALGGRESLLLTSADVFSDDETLHLRSRDPQAFSFSIIPDLGKPLSISAPMTKVADDGIFTHYSFAVEPQQIQVRLEKVRDVLPSSPVKMGPRFDWRPTPVAQAPDDADFTKAGIWRVTVPKSAKESLSDVFLQIKYSGDVARLYSRDNLLDDDFFDGKPWEIGLKRFDPEELAKGLELQILPLRKDAPIYLPKSSWPDFAGKSEIAGVTSVIASPEYEVTLKVSHPTPIP
ncbi:MAG: hypothetical protein NVS9B4_16360 [Candidatus Acidiferrum sp.]